MTLMNLKTKYIPSVTYSVVAASVEGATTEIGGEMIKSSKEDIYRFCINETICIIRMIFTP